MSQRQCMHLVGPQKLREPCIPICTEATGRLPAMLGPDGELPEALQKVEPAMLELVCNEIVERGGAVQWNDIAGQEQAKRLVQELVCLSSTTKVQALLP